MKTVRDFLRRHALLILSALVVLSIPFGVTFGKYVQSVTVTDTLNLNVSMKSYTLSKTVWMALYQSGNTFPAGVNLVLDYSAPAGTEQLKKGNTYIDLSDKTADRTTGPIYAYYDSASNTIYVVPETPGRMVATNCSMLFSTYYHANYRNMLKSIVINNLDTSQIQSMENMFSYNNALESIILGADSGFSTSNVTTMKTMFAECRAVTALDLSSFTTSRVTDMTNMFWRCNKLTNIAGLSQFDTSQVTTMSGMFCECSSMTSLNLSNFNTSRVTNMSSMFSGCSSLSSLNTGSFNTSNVTTMAAMFSGCSSLRSINLSNFDTSAVTTMDSMFDGCSGMTALNLANFNTVNVTNMYRMFAKMLNLQTITVSDKFDVSNVTDASKSADMFLDCYSLKGGAGTTYYWKNTDKTYAHIDGGTSDPGYFTAAPGTSTRSTFSATGTDVEANGFGLALDAAS